VVPELERHQQQPGRPDQLGHEAGTQAPQVPPGLLVGEQRQPEGGQALVAARNRPSSPNDPASSASSSPFPGAASRFCTSLVPRRSSRAAGPARDPSTVATQMAAASITTTSPVSQCWPGWRERNRASIG